MLRNVKDDKTFLSAKFQFSVIQFVKVISNKPFFLVKALNPGLKLLEGAETDQDKTNARQTGNNLKPSKCHRVRDSNPVELLCQFCPHKRLTVCTTIYIETDPLRVWAQLLCFKMKNLSAESVTFGHYSAINTLFYT